MRDAPFVEYKKTGDYNKLVEDTQGDWKRLARVILRKLGAPPYVDEEDVLQVMLMDCARHVRDWNPSKGPSLRTHVIWRTVETAKKFLHRERKTGRTHPLKPRSGSPTYELCFSSLVDRGMTNAEYENAVERMSPRVSAHQERDVSRNELIDFISENYGLSALRRRKIEDLEELNSAVQSHL